MNKHRLADDPWLRPFHSCIRLRREHVTIVEQKLLGPRKALSEIADAHDEYGLHRTANGWRFREWAPNALELFVVGPFSGWEASSQYRCKRVDEQGNWELHLSPDCLHHGDPYRLLLRWPEGEGNRIPAYARRVVQDDTTKIFNAQVWSPPLPFQWVHSQPPPVPDVPLIYEAHIGMAQDHLGIGTFTEFREHILPRIVDAGYNVLELMAILEHPYYASFGYHVSNFFAVSSRFGTPEQLKALIDAAHGAGLRVVMDLVHSHAVRNEVEGLSRFDGTAYQYFHDGERGLHQAWDSRCFDYSKSQVLRFLLSNCRFWLEQYRIDGFRFDGVTSMLYRHHGLGVNFRSCEDYFNDAVDNDAWAYLALANKLIHSLRPDAMTIAEDVSGMPGLCAPLAEGGSGFDLRLAMGVPDCWFRLAKEVRDEDWDLRWLWHELTNRRAEERTISYVECHDQAIVGGKTFAFELMGPAMYDSMAVADQNPIVDRGMALHKMARLLTVATAGHGYLNFVGNEFGHPEWIDFPREQNGWSFHHACRRWHLRDDPQLRYRYLADFDQAMLTVVAPALTNHDDASLLTVNESDKILALKRNGLLVILNFHSSQSVTDYAVSAPCGSYRLLLDTDEARFGGQHRLAPGQQYFTSPSLDNGKAVQHTIQIYLPCRTAIVLASGDADVT